jgi:hypothetical protein
MSTTALTDHLVPRYPTAIVKTTAEYKNNVEEWKGLIDELKERLQEATGEGKAKNIALHRKRGQLSGKAFSHKTINSGGDHLPLFFLL